MTRPGSRAELEAFRAEGEALGSLLGTLGAQDWMRPTRCPPLDLRQIVVHLQSQLEGVIETCAQPFMDSEPQKDRVTWWDYDIEEDQTETLAWILKIADQYPAEEIPARWSASVAEAVAAVEARLAAGDPAVRPGQAVIRLTDYIATRVLELTIHATDVLDALGRPPSPTSEGLAVTLDILADRLGADPRELGFDDTDFAILATGRRELTAVERERLGPLADEFPLLA